MAEHDGIVQMIEAEAVALFERAEMAEAAQKVAAHFREATTIAAGAEDARRQAQLRAKALDAKKQWVELKVQSEGGRVEHVATNAEGLDIQEAILRSLLDTNRSERATVAGEALWAGLAAGCGAYVPHPHRLEVRASEYPGKVYCFDSVEGEMGIHDENACPQMTLRHDTGGTTMLRRKGARGKLVLWPGRKE